MFQKGTIKLELWESVISQTNKRSIAPTIVHTHEHITSFLAVSEKLIEGSLLRTVYVIRYVNLNSLQNTAEVRTSKCSRQPVTNYAKH